MATAKMAANKKMQNKRKLKAQRLKGKRFSQLEALLSYGEIFYNTMQYLKEERTEFMFCSVVTAVL